MGQIQDRKTIKNLRNILIKKDIGEQKNNILLFLQNIEDESDAPAFYFNTSDIASKLKVSTPKKNRLFNFLRKEGYKAYNTHFDPEGFKTDAPIDKITGFFTR